MKNNKLPKYTRVLLVICSVLTLIVLNFPFWEIQLEAPQYPEGLVLLIYANKLAGNVDIINGLNHYIGMKTLHTADFYEFKVIPYIIYFFALIFLLTAIKGKRKWLNTSFILFVSFGVIAMVDFWKWNYNYGHNLNPNAAIVVPGMAYQPPLLGYKQLLNFGAYSIPDTGGWIFIGVGILLLVLVLLANRSVQPKRTLKIVKSAHLFLALMGLSVLFTACNTGIAPIVVGKDHCDFCKMPYNDTRFGAEIVTGNGKIYKFDDVHCALGFIKKGDFNKNKSYQVYFVNYVGAHGFIAAENCFFLKSETLRSPMNSNIAVFENKASLDSIQKEHPGLVYTWENQLKF